MGNYTSTHAPAVFAENIDTSKCNRRWGRPFIHTQTHTCNCSGETVFCTTPPQITARRNATAPQKSPVTTYPHVHVTAYWKTLRLPTPKPTHAITGGDLAHSQKQTSMCTRRWGAQPPNPARRQHLLRNHLTKHRVTLKKFLPSPFPESTNTHDMSLDVKNPCTDMQTPRPRPKGHDASLALTAAAEGLPVSLGHAQTCNSGKET